MSHVLLKTHLKPFEKYFKRKDIVEICVNEPGRIWLETDSGQWEEKIEKDLSLRKLNQFASTLATIQGQRFDEKTPILATDLPGYRHRIYIVGQGLAHSGFGMAIRIAQAKRFPLESYFQEDADKEDESEDDLSIKAGMSVNDAKELKKIIKDGKTILIAGGTGSGKTTFLNSAIANIPKEERLITIEDTIELVVDQPNSLRLIKSKTSTDIAQVTYPDIIDSCKRLRPDRLILGELDSKNAFAFLDLLNSGHGGSMTTIHAESIKETLHAVIVKCIMAGMDGGYDFASNYVKSVIPLVMFIERTKKRKFRSRIEYIKDIA